MDDRWYCARTKPRQEALAVEHLTRQKFEVYNPQVRIERFRHKRITIDREPLFPGYVLVKLILESSAWRAVNSTRGVLSLLTLNEDGVPSPIADREVQDIKHAEKIGKLFFSEIKRVRPGDKIRLKYGLATDAIGTVLFTRGERIELLFYLLGRQTRVKAPLHAVEVVDQAHH